MGWDYKRQRREREERIMDLTAEWLDRQPDWPVAVARLAAEHEDAFIHGTSDGPPPLGLLSQERK